MFRGIATLVTAGCRPNLFNEVQVQTGGGVSIIVHLPQQPLAAHEPPGLPHEGFQHQPLAVGGHRCPGCMPPLGE